MTRKKNLVLVTLYWSLSITLSETNCPISFSINTSTKIGFNHDRLSFPSILSFQFESSRLLLFWSKPQLQSRPMMLCRLGSTMPSRGLLEGSPFQQASISCQHSSSKLGSRSGLAPGTTWAHCSKSPSLSLFL